MSSDITVRRAGKKYRVVSKLKIKQGKPQPVVTAIYINGRKLRRA